MKYILVILWATANGAAVDHVEFDSAPACAIAMERITDEFSSSWLREPRMWCVSE